MPEANPGLRIAAARVFSGRVAHPMKPVLAVLTALFRQVMRVYFREVEVVGAPPASTARRLFGANHVNGIIDPVLVMTSTHATLSPVAKSTLWKIPGLSILLNVAEAVPIIRRQDNPDRAAGSNDEIFARVAAHLIKGGNMLIFPEGTSHSEPHVLPLKVGAGRMLTAAREGGGRGLTFQAVGLEFEERETFRSRVLVIFGPVRSVDDMEEQGPALAQAITTRLSEDLTELVVEGSTWEDRRLIARVAQLLAHDQGDRSLRSWNSIGRQVEAARKSLGDEHADLYKSVALSVDGYYRLLSAARLRDEDVLDGTSGEGEKALRLLWLAVLAPLALAGAVLYFVPYQIPKLATYLARTEEDVISTYKVGLGLIVFPLWALLLAALSLVLVPFPLSLGAVAAAILSPFAVLPWLDQIDQLQGLADETPEAMESVGGRQLLSARQDALRAIERARTQLGR
jgi:1-acyl-sn-glycerol-3-phosphate acyltransferase